MLLAFGLMLCMGRDGSYGFLLAPVFVLANGFLFFRALVRRAYQLAILYFLVAGAIALCLSIEGIGG